MNNFYNNYYQQNLFQKQMYSIYLNRMNYLMRNFDMNNNLYMPNNDIKSSYNNKNKNKNDSDLYDLIIDMNYEILKKLSKDHLIDIILFLRGICKIKINSKLTHLKHDILDIKKIKKKSNEYRLYIKDNIKRSSNIIEDIKYSYVNKENNLNEDKNIIKEENINNNNVKNFQKIENNNPNGYYCKIHNISYLSKDDYEAHCKTHLKCEICGLYFNFKKQLKRHRKSHYNNIINNNNLEKNMKESEQIENKKIKCTDCDLVFDSFESMSSHHYNFHQKKNCLNSFESHKNINEQKKIKEDMKKQSEKKDKIGIIQNQEELKGLKNLQMKDSIKKEEIKRKEDVKIEEYNYECCQDEEENESEERYI